MTALCKIHLKIVLHFLFLMFKFWGHVNCQLTHGFNIFPMIMRNMARVKKMLRLNTSYAVHIRPHCGPVRWWIWISILAQHFPECLHSMPEPRFRFKQSFDIVWNFIICFLLVSFSATTYMSWVLGWNGVFPTPEYKALLQQPSAWTLTALVSFPHRLLKDCKSWHRNIISSIFSFLILGIVLLAQFCMPLADGERSVDATKQFGKTWKVNRCLT